MKFSLPELEARLFFEAINELIHSSESLAFLNRGRITLERHTVVVIRPETFHRTGEHFAKFSDINSDPVELTLDNFVKLTGVD